MTEVSASEAAALTGLHIDTIRRYLREGRIKSRRVGRVYLIDRRSLAPLVRSKPTPGRPKGS